MARSRWSLECLGDSVLLAMPTSDLGGSDYEVISVPQAQEAAIST